MLSTKRLALAASTAGAAFAMFFAYGAPSAESVDVAAADVEVVVKPRAVDMELIAVQEMTNFLSRAFGRLVPAVKKPTPGKYSIFVGESEWSVAAGIDLSGMPRDTFIMQIEAKRCFLVGVDGKLHRCIVGFNGGSWSGAVGETERASTFAVYEFLEKYVGCRFYFPGEFGEIVPRVERLRLPVGRQVHTPSVLMRMYYFPSTFFDGKPVRWTGEKNLTGGMCSMRNWFRLRMSTIRIPFCHGTVESDHIGRYGTTHPEYFALRADGRRFTFYDGYPSSRHGMLCLSSGITNEIYRDAKAYLTGEPPESRKCAKGWKGKWVWPRSMVARKYVDIMPNDSFYKCRCDECMKRYAKGPMFFTPVVWGYTRDIAQRLIDEGIPGYITQMSYAEYNQVPDFDLPTNILVMVAKSGPFAVRKPKVHEAAIAAIKAWKDKVGKVCTWTYPDKYGTRKLPGVPMITPRAWAKFYKDTGDLTYGTFAEAECDTFFFNHLNFYVFSRIMWDTSVDPDAILDEYYRLMYGKAAPVVKKYFEALEDKFMDEIIGAFEETSAGPVSRSPSVHKIWTDLYSPKVLDGWDRLLDSGEAMLRPGSPEARRFAFMRRETQGVMRETSEAYLDVADVGRNVARLKANPPKHNLFDVAKTGDWRFEGGISGFDESEKVIGEKSFHIVATNNGAAVQVYLSSRTGCVIKPNTRYRLSYFVKGKDIAPAGTSGGAGVTLMDGYNRYFPEWISVSGTFGWTHQSFEFTSHPETNVKVESYVRFRVSSGTGEAWFDGMCLEELPDQVALPERTEVVVAPGAPDATVFAAEEMAKYLGKRFSGRTVPIVNAPREGFVSFILGTNAWSAAAGLAPEKLPRDSFILKTSPGRVYICGCDDPAENLHAAIAAGRLHAAERATVFGVYEFLEKYAGCRFFFPGTLGEFIEEGEDLPISKLDLKVSPSCAARPVPDDSEYAWLSPVAADKDPAAMRKLRLRVDALHRLRLREDTLSASERAAAKEPRPFAVGIGGKSGYDAVIPEMCGAGQKRWFGAHLRRYQLAKGLWDARENPSRIISDYEFRLFGRGDIAWYIGQVISKLSRADAKTLKDPKFIEGVEKQLGYALRTLKTRPDADLVRRRIELYRRELVEPLKKDVAQP